MSTERTSTAGRKPRAFNAKRPPEAGYWCTTFDKMRHFHDLIFDDYQQQAQHQAKLNLNEVLSDLSEVDEEVKQKLLVAFDKKMANKNRLIKKISFRSDTMTRKGLAARIVGVLRTASC